MLPESEMRHGFGGYTFCYVHAALGFCEFLYPGANPQLMFVAAVSQGDRFSLPRRSAPWNSVPARSSACALGHTLIRSPGPLGWAILLIAMTQQKGT
jgi:hypothetical protein